ncbi:phosphoribosylamine--glycine ligase [Ornithinibacillus halophilus]|uniref:Phosphoribosylamine--glycine ligase n=1 Tax=Ornithinibacillus halophilus TaxID=930117 RepID=A0A1M5ESY7_9BACI|nr:phosphoribosylamine--glycine ligase [Ornithinibacillus halophilus]SHF82375.1 phosphoribosylamine--glycine ligase [Ornithinibacillus halophilus]
MNVLVVGRGGREHSMVQKLAESKTVNEIYVAPGNAGMDEATRVPIDESEIERLIDFAKEKQIDMTIVGPENPLMLGISNRFREENLPIFAPTKEAALIEGSKDFAKAFMTRQGIPTASYQTFTDVEEAKYYVRTKGAPIVIKADGLAAGKGVVVAETERDALQAIDEMLVSKCYADAGTTIVIEEFLEGREFSLMAFVHGSNVYPMIPARDHKRAFDNDEGPNTGGMGAYAPVPDISEDIITNTTKEVLQKAADGLVSEGRSFTGILYAGLMMTTSGPKVIEFNARFGDPETQVILPLLNKDFLQVIVDVCHGKDPELQWEDKKCLGVVVAAQGYPATYEKNIPIPNLDCEETFAAYAGVDQIDNRLVSNGGRVMLVGAKATTYHQAFDAVYNQLNNIGDSSKLFYRSDIGKNCKEDALV